MIIRDYRKIESFLADNERLVEMGLIIHSQTKDSWIIEVKDNFEFREKKLWEQIRSSVLKDLRKIGFVKHDVKCGFYEYKKKNVHSGINTVPYSELEYKHFDTLTHWIIKSSTDDNFDVDVDGVVNVMKKTIATIENDIKILSEINNNK
jgi:hypothetical protein